MLSFYNSVVRSFRKCGPLCSAKLWKNSVCIAFLLIPTLGKSEWNIFNEDPDSANKNLVLCSLHFTADSFTNKAQIRCGIFKKIETKRRCCADYIWSDSNVTTQVWVTVFITWSLLLCLFYRSFDMYWVIFAFFYLNHSSVHLQWMYAVKLTQLLASRSIGCLLPSLQSAICHLDSK